MRLCIHCKKRPMQKHFNSKYCLPCKRELHKRPLGRLSQLQIQRIKRLIWKMPREEIAREVGTSVSTLKRWARDNGNVRLAFHNKYVIRPDLVKSVLEFYALHGKQKTGERFPGINVRAVVEYYGRGLQLRQKPWTPDQIRELVQMAGLISFKAQARYFNRPRANEGAIRSAWMKKFGQGGGQMNGLSWHVARHLVGARCKPVKTAFWNTRHPLRRDPMSRKIVLWTDLEKHLAEDQPEWIREAIHALARFQRWAHGVEHVRPRVIRLIEEREKYAKRTV